jgi:anti-anti-sigma factor
MNYQIENRADATIIHIAGHLTNADSRIWDRCLREASIATAKYLILDVRDLVHVDSGGLGFLIRPMMSSRKAGIRVALRHPQPALLRLMQMARFDRHFTIISA